MKQLTRFFVPLMVLLMAASVACHANTRVRSQDQWFAASINDNKVGYCHYTVRPISFEGKDCYEFNQEIVMVPAKTVISARTVVSAKDCSPVYESMSPTPVGEGDKRIPYWKHEVRYSAGAINCTIVADGKTTDKTIQIPKGSKLALGCLYRFGVKRPAVGQTIKATYFDIENLALTDCTISCKKKSKIRANDADVEVAPVILQTASSSLTTSYDDKGNLLKIEYGGELPLTLVAVASETEAKNGCVENGEGISRMPVDYEIFSAKYDPDTFLRLTDLKIKIVGVKDKNLAVCDFRQSARFLEEQDAVEYHVTVKPLDPSKFAKLPITDQASAEWLRSSQWVQSEDEQIRAQAKEIIGSETNAGMAVAKLRQWVHQNLTYKAPSSMPLSAIDILKSKTGDCKHYAILLAAMARSVGIPVRVVGGLVYDTATKSLQWHAWDECFIGDWISIDPTFPIGLVNAMYIKIGQNDDYEVTHKLMRRLIGGSAKVLEIKYSAPIGGKESALVVPDYPADCKVTRNSDGSTVYSMPGATTLGDGE